MEKYVYFFGGGKADGNGTMKDVLGGKGAGLAEMTNAGLPVPPGFTIVTSACRLYFQDGNKTPADILTQKDEALAKLEALQGQKLGDAQNPLLVSVRSGAKFSMPGMMDTILNLGMNDTVVEVIAAKTGNPRFAYDSYRRFIQMFGNVVMEIPKEKFEHVFDGQKKKKHDQARHRPDRRRPEGRDRRLQESGAQGSRQGLPPGPAGATEHVDRGRVPLLVQPPRRHLSPHEQDFRRPGDGRERPDHGFRQYGRYLRHRRGLYAQSRPPARRSSTAST